MSGLAAFSGGTQQRREFPGKLPARQPVYHQDKIQAGAFHGMLAKDLSRSPLDPVANHGKFGNTLGHCDPEPGRFGYSWGHEQK